MELRSHQLHFPGQLNQHTSCRGTQRNHTMATLIEAQATASSTRSQNPASPFREQPRFHSSPDSQVKTCQDSCQKIRTITIIIMTSCHHRGNCFAQSTAQLPRRAFFATFNQNNTGLSQHQPVRFQIVDMDREYLFQ